MEYISQNPTCINTIFCLFWAINYFVNDRKTTQHKMSLEDPTVDSIALWGQSNHVYMFYIVFDILPYDLLLMMLLLKMIINLLKCNKYKLLQYKSGWHSGLHVWLEVVGSSRIKGPRCFLEQETLPLLLSTGWFQKLIRAWFHNRTKINWGPYGRLTLMSNKPPR